MYNDAQTMLNDIIKCKLLRVNGVVGLFPAFSRGDDIVVFDENSQQVTGILYGLRQQVIHCRSGIHVASCLYLTERCTAHTYMYVYICTCTCTQLRLCINTRPSLSEVQCCFVLQQCMQTYSVSHQVVPFFQFSINAAISPKPKELQTRDTHFWNQQVFLHLYVWLLSHHVIVTWKLI